jgi:glyoxylate/hydroxypyruvate reductase A
MPRILFSAPPGDEAAWIPALEAACSARGVHADVVGSGCAPESVDYIVYAPGGGLEDFGPFANAKAVLSLWAGVERIVGNETIRIPLCRMVDPGLVEGMVEYVAGHVLYRHLGIDDHARNQDGVWRHRAGIPPLARDRGVGVLGLGELGGAVARALSTLGFNVAGWSARKRTLAGVETFAGDGELGTVLARSDILVLLLPATPETADVLNAGTLAMLPRGAVVINPGRGTLIDDAALLAALDSGAVAAATLDVFRVEPLPSEHPFWTHPRVMVTPHIASDTRPASAAGVIAENIARGEEGRPFLHVVDRVRAY